MSHRSLEDRYRLLLRAYPETFRRRHGADLLSALLDGAGPTQRRPGLRDTADLLGGGLRMRLLTPQPLPVRPTHELLPTPSSAALPESYGQALRTVWPGGFRPTVEDGRWPVVPRWLRRVGVLLVIALCVVGAVAGYRHFRAYEPLRSTGSAQTASMPAGSTVWVGPGLVLPGGGDLDLTAIHPVLRGDTAGVTVTVESCSGAGTDVLVSGASASWDAPGLCDSLRPIRDYRVRSAYLGRRVPLVLAVHATRPGVVRIAGVEIDVHQGLRHGTQHVGIAWTITVRPR